MKITFISNFFNHHQRFLSDELFDLTNREYMFVQTEEVPDERKKLGYSCETAAYVSEYNNDSYQEIQQHIDLSDAVIIGSAPEMLLKGRKKSGSLIFRYAERPLKNGAEWHKYFPRLLKWHSLNRSARPIYLLCSSAYTYSDYKKFGLFRNRAYKWGYFTQVKGYEDFNKLLCRKNKTKLLWCGRFLDWKHPEAAISVANRLKKEGYDFQLDFIGTGEMKDKLRNLIHEYQLKDNVRLLGSMSPECVRDNMEQAGIYLFTSDRQEGWGAVLNEAMNSGCAVVASHAVGAVPYLIKDGENGFVYESENENMLYDKVKKLLDDFDLQERFGKAAYRTIVDEWNPEVAAQRFIKLSTSILQGNKYPDLYKSGPCSKAEFLNDDWFIKR